VAECVTRSAGRLRGAASADLTRPVRAVREPRRRGLGFAALRWSPWLVDELSLSGDAHRIFSF
jgi:hypothetical protein